MTSFRPLPQLNELNRPFWTSGADGQLRMQRCRSCGHWLHPAGVICSECLSRDLAAEALTGLATVEAVTINYQPWTPGVPVPYVVAIVGLDEQKGLNLTTNIIGIPVEDVHIGQRVKVVFEQIEEVYLPLFTPVEN
ncbi:MAG: OB-fold domain-containing protein [Azoarcus sp.]|jgi:uncharacterized OB-fold protein|nr:OB-fold domain-containing protein [Azoarcus sp.]